MHHTKMKLYSVVYTLDKPGTNAAQIVAGNKKQARERFVAQNPGSPILEVMKIGDLLTFGDLMHMSVPDDAVLLSTNRDNDLIPNQFYLPQPVLFDTLTGKFRHAHGTTKKRDGEVEMTALVDWSGK